MFAIYIAVANENNKGTKSNNIHGSHALNVEVNQNVTLKYASLTKELFWAKGDRVAYEGKALCFSLSA